MPTLTQSKLNAFGHQETLWHLADDIVALEDAIFEIQEDESILNLQKEEKMQALFDRWLEAGSDFNEKAVRVAGYIKYLEALSEARQAEYRRLRELAQSAEYKSKKLREYLVAQMERVGAKRIEGVTATLSLRKKPAKVVLNVDPTELPEQFQKVTVEAKLTAIKDYLKSNPDCDFAFMSDLNEQSLMIK